MISLGLQDCAEMLGPPGQSHNVSSNILRRGMVVVENRRYLIGHAVPCLSRFDIEREDAVHKGEYKDKDLILYKASNSEAGSALCLTRLVHDGRSIIRRRKRGLSNENVREV